jgi:hypothetical protein
MKARLPLALWLAASAGALTALVVGCSGNRSPLDPEAAPAFQAQADLSRAAAAGRTNLDALWPNEDGRRWEYRYAGAACEPPTPTAYADPARVPPVPGLDVLLRLLGSRRGAALEPPAGCETLAAPYAMQFKGMTTTESGVTAQNLEEQMMLGGLAREPEAAGGWEARFLAHLARARPDLAPRLGLAPRPARQIGLWFYLPLFLHGGAWEKTADYIGTYGVLDQRLAWKFLDADVSPGSSFVYQLIPSLADDVFLHGWVVPRSRALRLKAYPRALQVVYVVDLGVSEVVDHVGTLLGYFRPIDYGTVVYAPGVGPVLCSERFYAPSDDPAASPAANLITLERMIPGPVPAAVAGLE